MDRGFVNRREPKYKSRVKGAVSLEKLEKESELHSS